MFQLVEKSLDPVSEFIGLFVVWNLDFAVSLGRDDRFDFCLFDDFAQLIGVVSLVGNHATRGLAIQQLSRGGTVVGLAASQDEAQRPALSVREGVDFRGQPSSGTPQSLILCTPFPLAAC